MVRTKMISVDNLDALEFIKYPRSSRLWLIEKRGKCITGESPKCARHPGGQCGQEQQKVGEGGQEREETVGELIQL